MNASAVKGLISLLIVTYSTNSPKNCRNIGQLHDKHVKPIVHILFTKKYFEHGYILYYRMCDMLPAVIAIYQKRGRRHSE